VNVNELTDLLAGYIAQGRGNDKVFVGLTGEVMDDRHVQDALDPYNWEVSEVDGNDGRSNFVQLFRRAETQLTFLRPTWLAPAGWGTTSKRRTT
jgi:transketolase N-terminal domain/subunit